MTADPSNFRSIFIPPYEQLKGDNKFNANLNIPNVSIPSPFSAIPGISSFPNIAKTLRFAGGPGDHGWGSHQTTNTQALDLEEQELPELIIQHPTWLRPFSVTAEVEKHSLEEEVYRLIRSTSGYLRVVKLTNGSEWAYFEQMSQERFLRIPLLREIYHGEQLWTESSLSNIWSSKPAKLQTLQRGSRWELVENGELISEEK